MSRLRQMLVLITWLALIPGSLAVTRLSAEPVDINRATVAELLQVPGMTEVWAKRIARFRPYRTKRALLDQGVVSPEVYQRIRERIVAHLSLK